MWSKKDTIVFLAGAEAAHTLSHLFINYYCPLPIQFWSIMWTPQLNLIAIVVNTLITIGLLWWASKLR
jgi:hypothetical protein